MKKVLFFFMSLLNVATASADDTNYIINCAIGEEVEGKTVYLTNLDNTSIIDSAVVRNGRFHMEGKIEHPQVAVLSCKDFSLGKPNENVYVALDGSEAQLTLKVGNYPEVSGSCANIALNSFKKTITPRDIASDEEYENARKTYEDSNASPEAKKQAADLLNKYLIEMRNRIIKFCVDNNNNIGGAMYFGKYNARLSSKQIDMILATASDEFKSYKAVEQVIKRREAEKKREKGNKYIDFEMADSLGVMHKLSDYVQANKVTILDCWASWCGPCRALMPELKRVYAEYHDKGLEIVGVSFDKDKNAWIKCTNQMDLPWVHLSDLKCWECEVGLVYGVNGIPFTLLIDRNGIIQGCNLHGKKLRTAIEEILAK